MRPFATFPSGPCTLSPNPKSQQTPKFQLNPKSQTHKGRPFSEHPHGEAAHVQENDISDFLARPLSQSGLSLKDHGT